MKSLVLLSALTFSICVLVIAEIWRLLDLLLGSEKN